MKNRAAAFSISDRHHRGLSLVMVVSLIALLSFLAISLLAMVSLNRQTNHLEAESRKSEMFGVAAFHAILADLGAEMRSGAAGVSEMDGDDGRKIRLYDLIGKREAMVVSRATRLGTFADSALVKQSAAGVPFPNYGGPLVPRASDVSTTAGDDSLDPPIWSAPRLLDSSVSFDQSNTPDRIYVCRNGKNPVSLDNSNKLDSLSTGMNPQFVIGRFAYNLYDTSGLLDINAAGQPTGYPSKERVGEKGSLIMADLASLPEMNAESVSKLRPDSLPDSALSRLTHFSRDLDAPSWHPHPDRPRVKREAGKGGNDGYGQDLVLNPDLAVFDPNRKRPFLPRRFPLERIKWLEISNAGVPLDAAKAERYFGLKGTGGGWEYVHARSDGRMYSLQDLPADREAKFFEILRATVLVGSLGRQFAARAHDDADQLLPAHQLPKGGIGGVDASVNLNIMELGACLIDQYDADSYPTAIAMTGGSRPYLVFGKEDVPYLTRLSAIPYRGSKTFRIRVYSEVRDPADPQKFIILPASTEVYEAAMVMQPMLWRPHQVVEKYDGPSEIGVRPQHVDQGGGSMFYLTSGWRVPGGNDPPTPNRGSAGDYRYWGGPNYRATEPEFFPKTFTGAEYLDVTVALSSTAFREPQSVHSPAHGAIAGYSVGRTATPTPVRSGDLRWNGLPTSFNEVSGFLVGHAITARIESGAAGQSRLQVGYFRGGPIEVMMEYRGPDNGWHPYQMANFTYKSNWGHPYLKADPEWQTEAIHWSSYLIDPRTARFGGLATVLAGGLNPKSWTSLDPLMTWPEGSALGFGKTRAGGVRPGWTVPAANTGWSFNGDVDYFSPYNPAGVAENNKVARSGKNTFAYMDPDDVRRPGVAANNEYESGADGNPLSRRAAMSSTGSLSLTSSSLAGRPRILNRPFRSVAELAYSFRGTPWRDVDFLNPSSSDSGLLDVFSVYENPDEDKVDDPNPPVVAGRVNLNSAGVDVIAALLSGAALDEDLYFAPALAKDLAKDVHQWIRSTESGKGPFTSKVGMVGSSVPNESATGLVYEMSNKLTKAVDRSINDRREFAVRALSGGTTVQAWDFLLDLVVQTGRLLPSAAALDQFLASAEKRHWVHFAIDRPTGQVLDVQCEPVNL
jgi:hypothetical protein